MIAIFDTPILNLSSDAVKHNVFTSPNNHHKSSSIICNFEQLFSTWWCSCFWKKRSDSQSHLFAANKKKEKRCKSQPRSLGSLFFSIIFHNVIVWRKTAYRHVFGFLVSSVLSSIAYISALTSWITKDVNVYISPDSSVVGQCAS